jgi:hypothetical protein
VELSQAARDALILVLSVLFAFAGTMMLFFPASVEEYRLQYSPYPTPKWPYLFLGAIFLLVGLWLGVLVLAAHAGNLP